jgi:hypothetical protein
LREPSGSSFSGFFGNGVALNLKYLFAFFKSRRLKLGNSKEFRWEEIVAGIPGGKIIRFISKFVDQNFTKNRPMARKERKIAPQASAGVPLFISILFAFRKAQRRREKKASENPLTPPPQVKRDLCLMVASKMTFLSGP